MVQEEIADILKISRSTVSLALRDSPKVKKQTKDRVKKLASTLNYRPNMAARSLSLKKTFLIGVITPSFSHPFFAELTAKIHSFLHKQGYTAIFFPVTGPNDCKEAIEFLLNRGVEGIIVTSDFLTREVKSIMELQKENIGMVFFNKPVILNNYVSVDIYKGGCLATEHLIKCGHRTIGFIGSAVDEPRFIGYKDTLLKHKAVFDENWITPYSHEQCRDYMEQGYECMKKILSFKEMPTAVFARNDVFAIGAMHAIGEAGMKMPGEMAMVGFDNIREGRFLTPSLTTISLPVDIIAGELVRIIVSIAKKQNSGVPYEEVVIQPELVVRKSCGFKGD